MKNIILTGVDYIVISLVITALAYAVHTGFEKEDRRMDMIEEQVQILIDEQTKSNPDMPDSKLKNIGDL